MNKNYHTLTFQTYSLKDLSETELKDLAANRLFNMVIEQIALHDTKQKNSLSNDGICKATSEDLHRLVEEYDCLDSMYGDSIVPVKTRKLADALAIALELAGCKVLSSDPDEFGMILIRLSFISPKAAGSINPSLCNSEINNDPSEEKFHGGAGHAREVLSSLLSVLDKSAFQRIQLAMRRGNRMRLRLVDGRTVLSYKFNPEASAANDIVCAFSIGGSNWTYFRHDFDEKRVEITRDGKIRIGAHEMEVVKVAETEEIKVV